MFIIIGDVHEFVAIVLSLQIPGYTSFMYLVICKLNSIVFKTDVNKLTFNFLEPYLIFVKYKLQILSTNFMLQGL